MYKACGHKKKFTTSTQFGTCSMQGDNSKKKSFTIIIDKEGIVVTKLDVLTLAANIGFITAIEDATAIACIPLTTSGEFIPNAVAPTILVDAIANPNIETDNGNG